MAEQAMQMKKAKQEVIEEMHANDFATKKDLLDLEIKLYKEISSSKWQVIGLVAAMLFVEIVLRHFGI